MRVVKGHVVGNTVVLDEAPLDGSEVEVVARVAEDTLLAGRAGASAPASAFPLLLGLRGRGDLVVPDARPADDAELSAEEWAAGDVP